MDVYGVELGESGDRADPPDMRASRAVAGCVAAFVVAAVREDPARIERQLPIGHGRSGR
jgi:hypothetical protein